MNRKTSQETTLWLAQLEIAQSNSKFQHLTVDDRSTKQSVTPRTKAASTPHTTANPRLFEAYLG